MNIHKASCHVSRTYYAAAGNPRVRVLRALPRGATPSPRARRRGSRGYENSKWHQRPCDKISKSSSVDRCTGPFAASNGNIVETIWDIFTSI